MHVALLPRHCTVGSGPRYMICNAVGMPNLLKVITLGAGRGSEIDSQNLSYFCCKNAIGDAGIDHSELPETVKPEARNELDFDPSSISLNTHCSCSGGAAHSGPVLLRPGAPIWERGRETLACTPARLGQP